MTALLLGNAALLAALAAVRAWDGLGRLAEHRPSAVWRLALACGLYLLAGVNLAAAFGGTR